jgi:hypothetical protein
LIKTFNPSASASLLPGFQAWITTQFTIYQLFNRLTSAMRVLAAFVRNKLAIGCGCLLAILFIDPGVNFSVIVMLLFYYRLEVYFEVK